MLLTSLALVLSSLAQLPTVLGMTPRTTFDDPAPTPLQVGQTFAMHSETLDETRRINVFLPAAYDAAPDARFPVLYMPDGGAGEDFVHLMGLVQILSLNGAMRPHILVGIENTQRRRDLTGPTDQPRDREIAPVVGGSAHYRTFLRDELRPIIQRLYRTTDETALIGESLAGLFVVETLLLEPTLFDTYLAIDPSLWWNDEKLIKTASEHLATLPMPAPTLYLATGRDSELAEPAQRLADVLRQDVPELQLTTESFPKETHLTIFHPAALVGLRTVFAREE